MNFSIKKHYFLSSFVFCICFTIRTCLYSNVWYPIFCHADRKLILCVLRGSKIFHLVLYDLGIIQVLLDVQILEKLENLPIFLVVPLFVVNLIVEARFFNLQD